MTDADGSGPAADADALLETLQRHGMQVGGLHLHADQVVLEVDRADVARLGEALVDVDATPTDGRAPTGGYAPWSPWPATSTRLVGSYRSRLGCFEVTIR